MRKRYPEKTLILDFTPEFEGDTWRPKHPMIGVYYNINNPLYAPDAQHGTSATLYRDMPGARLWWFVSSQCDKEITSVKIYS
jgi:hypothetical protein